MARILDVGTLDYMAALELQKSALEARIAGEIEDTVIVVDHPPVFTVGRKQHSLANVLNPGETPVVEVDRGGDVTWHGPGQIVAYPIVKLEGTQRDLHAWLRTLEEVMIRTVAAFGLHGVRDPRNTGTWVGGRKVGSVGIACRRWVTWHGLALNVNPDLAWFSRIHPCGLDSALLTSMEVAAGRPMDVARVRAVLCDLAARLPSLD